MEVSSDSGSRSSAEASGTSGSRSDSSGELGLTASLEHLHGLLLEDSFLGDEATTEAIAGRSGDLGAFERNGTESLLPLSGENAASNASNGAAPAKARVAIESSAADESVYKELQAEGSSVSHSVQGEAPAYATPLAKLGGRENAFGEGSSLSGTRSQESLPRAVRDPEQGSLLGMFDESARPHLRHSRRTEPLSAGHEAEMDFGDWEHTLANSPPPPQSEPVEWEHTGFEELELAASSRLVHTARASDTLPGFEELELAASSRLVHSTRASLEANATNSFDSIGSLAARTRDLDCLGGDSVFVRREMDISLLFRDKHGRASEDAGHDEANGAEARFVSAQESSSADLPAIPVVARSVQASDAEHGAQDKAALAFSEARCRALERQLEEAKQAALEPAAILPTEAYGQETRAAPAETFEPDVERTNAVGHSQRPPLGQQSDSKTTQPTEVSADTSLEAKLRFMESEFAEAMTQVHSLSQERDRLVAAAATQQRVVPDEAAEAAIAAKDTEIAELHTRLAMQDRAILDLERLHKQAAENLATAAAESHALREQLEDQAKLSRRADRLETELEESRATCKRMEAQILQMGWLQNNSPPQLQAQSSQEPTSAFASPADTVPQQDGDSLRKQPERRSLDRDPHMVAHHSPSDSRSPGPAFAAVPRSLASVAFIEAPSQDDQQATAALEQEQEVIRRLQEERIRLRSAQDRIRSASAQSSRSLEFAIGELRALEAARQRAEERAARLEEQVERSQRDMVLLQSLAVPDGGSRSITYSDDPEPSPVAPAHSQPQARQSQNVESRRDSMEGWEAHRRDVAANQARNLGDAWPSVERQGQVQHAEGAWPSMDRPGLVKESWPRGENAGSAEAAPPRQAPVASLAPPFERASREASRGTRGEEVSLQRRSRSRGRENESQWSFADMFPQERDEVEAKAPGRPELRVADRRDSRSTREVAALAPSVSRANAGDPSGADWASSRDSLAPYATEASSRDFHNGFSLLERKLMMINMEREKCEADFARLANRGVKTKEALDRKVYLENRLEELHQEASNVRIALKRAPK